MTKTEKIFGTYIRRMAAAILGFVISILALNSAVDPLWYFNGNLLFPKNFLFDERTAKSNRLLKSPGAYNCLIFGDSRTALLDQAMIAGYRCFNYAFSSGRPAEFPVFARYAKFAGVDADIVIIGVEGSNLAVKNQVTPDPYLNIPDFVQNESMPRPVWLTYLSIDAVEFSLRSLAYHFFYRLPPVRIYNRDFKAQASASAARFKLETGLGDVDEVTGYSSDHAATYDQIRAVYPNARIVGFVPFASSWEIAGLQSRGLLTAYVTAMHETASSFDVFFDFSIPSDMTSDPSMTYDGVHYYSQANGSIARTIDTGKLEVGIKVTGLDLDSYSAAYKQALSAYEGFAN